MNKRPTKPERSNPAHLCAWLLACATFPLIWVGGLVTTTDAGMAFRDWLTSDGTFMLFYDWFSAVGDKFVEHGHRLLGAAVGFLSIVLVAVVWRTESRGWVRKLSWAILAGVILQGVLGGMRVMLDQQTLALVHGCTAPLFFGMCVAMVVFTSPWWHRAVPSESPEAAKKLCRVAIVCTCLAYLQLVVGALLRHSPHMLSDAAATLFQLAVYFHLILAVLVTGAVARVAWHSMRAKLCRVGAVCLSLLIGLQLFLGVATWIVNYGVPAWATAMVGEMHFVNAEANLLQSWIVTSHVAVGSLIVVSSLAVALRVGRSVGVVLPLVALKATRLAEVGL